jgi:hypothetical protein
MLLGDRILLSISSNSFNSVRVTSPLSFRAFQSDSGVIRNSSQALGSGLGLNHKRIHHRQVIELLPMLQIFRE